MIPPGWPRTFFVSDIFSLLYLYKVFEYYKINVDIVPIVIVEKTTTTIDTSDYSHAYRAPLPVLTAALIIGALARQLDLVVWRYGGLG